MDDCLPDGLEVYVTLNRKAIDRCTITLYESENTQFLVNHK